MNTETARTGSEDIDLSIPRDRNGKFEPQTVKKHQRRLPGFDDKVLALYARGMKTSGRSIRHRTWRPPEIRKVIYTTNATESMQAQLRKVTRNRGSFPTADSVRKVIYSALQRISQKWKRPTRIGSQP